MFLISVASVEGAVVLLYPIHQLSLLLMSDLFHF